MSTPTTEPVQLANPHLGMDDYIKGLRDEGMADAVAEAGQTPASDIAPATPPPKKEDAPPAKPAEPAKETPKEAPKPQPESEDDKWPRSAKDWEARKAAEKKRLEAKEQELASIRSERDTIKAEIEQLRKQGPSPELEKLKQEKAELDEQLRLVAVERHPKFKTYFDSKVNSQIELAKRVVGSEKAEQIAELLKAPESSLRNAQLEEMISTLGTLQQAQLGSVLTNLSMINAEREAEVTKARENYEQMQKQEQEALEGRQRQFQKTFDDTVKSATDPKEGNPAFLKRDGDDAWNAEVDRRLETAKSLLFGNPTPEVISKAALAAVALQPVLSQLTAQIKENESLKAQIAELKAATPKIDAGKQTETSSDTPQPVKIKPGSNPMEALGGWMDTVVRTTE